MIQLLYIRVEDDDLNVIIYFENNQFIALLTVLDNVLVFLFVSIIICHLKKHLAVVTRLGIGAVCRCVCVCGIRAVSLYGVCMSRG